ncbi:MAG: hypothetical protein KC609_05815, partial [Myxococcales bacterium]|nr:hypothetical protein [Myxococcales bacterium]
ILSWFGNPSLPCPPVPTRDISLRAREIRKQALAGKVRYAEPFLAQIVERVAAIDDGGEAHVQTHDLFERIRSDLVSPREFDEEQFPFEAVREQSLILPQYNRLRIEQVVWVDRVLYLLGRDYREPGERDEDGKPKVEFYWRLFRYDSRRQRVEEIKGLPFEPDGTKGFVIGKGDGDLVIVAEQHLYRLNDEGELHDFGVLDIPLYGESTTFEVRRAVAYGDEVYVASEEEGDEIYLFGFSRDAELLHEYGFAGSLAGNLLFARASSQLIYSQLFELHAVGASLEERQRDFRLYFSEFSYSPHELLAEDVDGRLYYSNGSKVLCISADLSTITDEFVLPGNVIHLDFDENGDFSTVAHDRVGNTLILCRYRRG